MAKAAVLTHPDFLLHGSAEHVERPDRLSSILAALDRAAVPGLERLTPTEATLEQIGRVHPPSYVNRLQSVSESGGGWIDADTVLSRQSARAARLAAGAAVSGVEAVTRDGYDVVFSLCRPPGHHALPQTAMGFCLLNNVAIAARHAQQALGIERVMIVDWDVHHGNGTQDVFYHDPGVLFFSVHQSPLYPGTGLIRERGDGAGLGTTVNVPLPGGLGDPEYLQVFERILRPAARQFKPQLILVSAGFDAHQRDPLANMNVSTDGFRQLAAWVRALAEETPAGGKVVAVLEGGYDLQALSESVVGVLETWTAPSAPDLGHAEPDAIAPAARRVIESIEPTLV
ncbi:MAG TPA: histone deacetylase [Candidatus Xenobia bacterium]